MEDFLHVWLIPLITAATTFAGIIVMWVRLENKTETLRERVHLMETAQTVIRSIGSTMRYVSKGDCQMERAECAREICKELTGLRVFISDGQKKIDTLQRDFNTAMEKMAEFSGQVREYIRLQERRNENQKS